MTAVDYGFSRPTLAQLKGAGVTDVFRYVGPIGWGKTITQAEYDELTGAGIGVHLVFEQGSNDSAGGFGAGASNAELARANLPAGYSGPIWFACDEELEGGALATAVAYIAGASSVLGATRTGVYGQGTLLDAVAGAHTADWYWQSDSTSFPGNASQDSHAQVVQHAAGPLPGTDGDTIVWTLAKPPGAPSPIQKPTTGRYGTLNKPIVAILPTPDAKGYTEVAADGGTFNYGDAPMLGSLASKPLNAPIVDAARTPDGKGIVMVATDGGVFCLGDSKFEGSEGGKTLNAPVVAIALTPTGKGYWLTAADGGVFCFGDAQFHGSAA